MSNIEIKEDGTPLTAEGAGLSPQQRAANTRAANKSADKIVEIGEDAQESAGSVTEYAAVLSGENHDSQLSGKKVRVTFFEQEIDGGSDAIFCSLNGYAYQIPRNVPVDIPVEVLAIFNNARTDLLETAHGGGSRKRTINRFSYTVHA